MTNRLFAPIRQTGRSVNLASSMAKRSPIFTQNALEKIELSPFSNYGYVASEKNIMNSDVSIMNGINELNGNSLQDIRKIVKEQLQKHIFLEESNRKSILTTQAQVNDIKEKCSQIEKGFTLQEQNILVKLQSDLANYVTELCNDNAMDIKLKMRTVFEKGNQQLKKQLIGQIGKQCAPISILDDFIDFQQRFSLLQNQKIKLTQSDNAKPALLPQNVELKIAKFEKDVDVVKKLLSEHTASINELGAIPSELTLIKNQAKSYSDLVINLSEKIKKVELESHLNLEHIESLNRLSAVNVENIQKLKLLNDKLYQSFESSNEEVKKITTEIAAMGKVQKSLSESVSNIPMLNSMRSEKALLLSSTKAIIIPSSSKDLSGSDLGDTMNSDSVRSSIAPVKQTYMIDLEGFVMDNEGKYLMLDDNTFLRVTPQQIKMLETDKDVEVTML